MTAPVEPAEKKPWAFPFLMARHARTMLDLRFVHDRLDGVILHCDDLGRDERLGAVVLAAERLHDIGGTGDEHLERPIGRECRSNA